MTLPRIRISILAALLIVAGCGKKSPPSTATPATPPVAADSSATEQPATSPTPLSGPVPAPAQPAMPTPAPPVQPIVVDPSANTATVLGQLTQALRKYSFEHRRVPKTLSEVIGAGYVTTVPQAPPGKQFAVDVKKVEVVLVRQ